MREVKVPDFMQPFEVIVNGVKQVFPAGETVTVEDLTKAVTDAGYTVKGIE